MTSPHSPSRIACWFGSVLVILTMSGCEKRDLSGYRPAGHEEHAESVSETPEVTSSSDEKSKVADSNVPTTIQPQSEIDVETEDPNALEADPSLAATDSSAAAPPASALIPVNVVSSVRELMSVPNSNPAKTGIADSLPPRTSPDVAAEAEGEPATLTNRIEVLIKEKKFQTESKTGALRVSFDDLDLLKVLNMEPVTQNAVDLMPEWLKGLDGKPVRIRGFMYPTYETEGIERFVLARDNQICCFGRDPKIYDLIQIDMKEGKTTNYIPATRAFDVVGTLRIKMVAPDGTPYGLYFIEQATVIDR